MSLCGVIICAISVGFFKHAALGVDPFQSLMAGLDAMIPIEFGTLYVIVNAILLLFTLVFDRKNIGIATAIYLFLLGYVTEFSYAFLQTVFVDPSLLTRIICLIVGVVVLSFGSSLYMTANLGVSTYDAVAIVLSDKWKVARFQYCRIASDVVCVALGVAIYLLSGGAFEGVAAVAGIGTIITAFFMGPIIAFFNEKIAKPMLNK